MVTQNDNTAEIPAKAEETLKPLQPQGMDGKSTMLGKSVMVGQKSTVIGQSVMVARKSTVANKTDPMKQPKVPQSMVKAPPSLGPPKSAAIGAFPGGAGEMPNHSKYMAA
uniref:Uncharacterized protein n=1 Tax=Panagrolaimus davidi TaxID=227884 RepID=A0A914PK06_9BILA